MRAVEVVLERAIAHTPQLFVAQHFLRPSRFAAWIRPRAYDVLHAPASTLTSWDSTDLVALLDRSMLADVVGTPPDGYEPDDLYCPRCARLYRAGAVHCVECDGFGSST
jgi:hypothetical protein